MEAYAQASLPEVAEPLLNPADIAGLVERYLPLVASTVDRIWLSGRIGLTREDLVSAGSYGLLLAARRFDPARGVGFGVFARSHVHGAIMREINTASRAGFASVEDLLTADGGPVQPDSLPDERSNAAIDSAEASEIRNLMECLLTESERTVLSLYFYEELTLAELAAVLECSESAAARSIKRVLKKLKTAMTERRNQ